MMEEIKLKKAQEIQNFKDPMKNVLMKLYAGKGYKMLIGILINSIMTEKKYTFLLDKKSFELLINTDPNLKKINFKLLSDVFQHFIKTATEAKFITTLKKVKDLSETFVMNLSHPHFVKYLEKEVGKEAMLDQKTFVLQMVEASIGFYDDIEKVKVKNDDFEFTPKQNEFKFENSIESEEDIPIDPLFEARKKAIKLGLVKGNFQDEIKELENALVKEKIRYRSLLDKAKEEDDRRLQVENEEGLSKDELSEHFRLTRIAVEAGIMASKQRKLLDDIEYKLTELKKVSEEGSKKSTPKEKKRDLFQDMAA